MKFKETENILRDGEQINVYFTKKEMVAAIQRGEKVMLARKAGAKTAEKVLHDMLHMIGNVRFQKLVFKNGKLKIEDSLRPVGEMFAKAIEYFDEKGYGHHAELAIESNGSTITVQNVLTHLYEIEVDSKTSYEILESAFSEHDETGKLVDLWVASGQEFLSLKTGKTTKIVDPTGKGNILAAAKHLGFTPNEACLYSPNSVKSKRAFLASLQDETDYDNFFSKITHGISEYFEAVAKEKAKQGKELSNSQQVKTAARTSQSIAGSMAAEVAVDDINAEIVVITNEELAIPDSLDGRDIHQLEVVALLLNVVAKEYGVDFVFTTEDIKHLTLQTRVSSATKSGTTLMTAGQLETIMTINGNVLNLKHVTFAEWDKLRLDIPAYEAITKEFHGFVISNNDVDMNNIKPTMYVSENEMKVPMKFEMKNGRYMFRLPILKSIGSTQVKEDANASYQLHNTMNDEMAVQMEEHIRVEKALVLAGNEKDYNSREEYIKAVEESVAKIPTTTQELMYKGVVSVKERSLKMEEDEEGKLRYATDLPTFNTMGLDKKLFTRDIVDAMAPNYANLLETVVMESKLRNFTNAFSRSFGQKSRMLIEQAYVVGTPNLSALLVTSLDEIAKYNNDNKLFDGETDVDKLPAERRLRASIVNELRELQVEVEAQIRAEQEGLEDILKLNDAAIKEEVYNRIAALEYDTKGHPYFNDVVALRKQNQAKGKTFHFNIFDAIADAELLYSPSVVCSGEVFSKAAIQYAAQNNVPLKDLQTILLRYPKPGVFDAPSFRFLGLKELKRRIAKKVNLVAAFNKNIKMTKSLAVAMQQNAYKFFQSRGTGEVVMPIDINVNLILSGSDWDTDSFYMVFDQEVVRMMRVVANEIHESDKL